MTTRAQPSQPPLFESVGAGTPPGARVSGVNASDVAKGAPTSWQLLRPGILRTGGQGPPYRCDRLQKTQIPAYGIRWKRSRVSELSRGVSGSRPVLFMTRVALTNDASQARHEHPDDNKPVVFHHAASISGSWWSVAAKNWAPRRGRLILGDRSGQPSPGSRGAAFAHVSSTSAWSQAARWSTWIHSFRSRIPVRRLASRSAIRPSSRRSSGGAAVLSIGVAPKPPSSSRSASAGLLAERSGRR